MDPDLAEVVRLELSLLEPHVRHDADHVRRLLHPEFVEFGSSGRVWDRDAVILMMGGESGNVSAVGLTPRRLAPDVVLVTYTSEAGGRSALRSSTWVRDQTGWRLLFHQGTPTGT